MAMLVRKRHSRARMWELIDCRIYRSKVRFRVWPGCGCARLGNIAMSIVLAIYPASMPVAFQRFSMFVIRIHVITYQSRCPFAALKTPLQCETPMQHLCTINALKHPSKSPAQASSQWYAQQAEAIPHQQQAPCGSPAPECGS